jgi:hypothetical protein
LFGHVSGSYGPDFTGFLAAFLEDFLSVIVQMGGPSIYKTVEKINAGLPFAMFWTVGRLRRPDARLNLSRAA